MDQPAASQDDGPAPEETVETAQMSRAELVRALAEAKAEVARARQYHPTEYRDWEVINTYG